MAEASIYGREQGPWLFARGRAHTARWHGLVRPVELWESDGCRVPALCGHGAVFPWADFDDRLPPVNEFNRRCATCVRLGAFGPTNPCHYGFPGATRAQADRFS